MAKNPPWADKVIDSHWEALSAGASRLKLPLPKNEVVKKKHKPTEELGCAHYGCVWRSEQPGVVVKLTTDQTEAHTIAASMYLKEKKGFDPEGIVKYYAVFALPEQHRGRPVFVLWREEADSVGLPSHHGYVKLDYDTREFSKLLARFKTLAHEARLIAVKEMKKIGEKFEEIRRLERDITDINSWAGSSASSKSEEAKLAKVREKVSNEKDPMSAYWAWIKSQVDMGDMMHDEFYERYGEEASGVGRFDDDKILNALMRRHKGMPNRFAWLIEACKQIAVEMENANGKSYLVGKALNEYMEEGLLLADVHHNNVGVLRRPDYTGGIFVITDPGHAIVLKKELSEIQIPTLE